MPPHHLRWVFKTLNKLGPWSMIDVLLLGAFVAYVKLQDIVQIDIGAALVALVALSFVMTWLSSLLDFDAIWEELQRRRVAGPRLDAPVAGAPLSAGVLSCHGWAGAAATRRRSRLLALRRDAASPQAEQHRPHLGAVSGRGGAVRAGQYLSGAHRRAAWRGCAGTILGGVRELIEAKMWPLAALVFLASVAIPMLKLVGLGTMLVCVQTGTTARLRERTSLYKFVLLIGRWSMVDIFMVSLLGALVQFGNVVTIQPGVGAVAFCSVVILTMFAAESLIPG